MSPRKKPPEPTQARVLLQSRRRCCICFGLNKDDSVKRGQIAHIDGNRDNNAPGNLAFLCLDQHDSTTSQSKGFTQKEIKAYRDELHTHFSSWAARANRDELLSYLADTIDTENLADGAIKVCSQLVAHGAEHAYYVLVASNVDYCDSDLLIPYQRALDYFASWGWMTYDEEVEEDDDGDVTTLFRVAHKPICREVADIIRKRVANGSGDLSLLEHFDGLAQFEALDDPRDRC